jgi:hypothetical protein
MGCCRLALSVFVLSFVLALAPQPASANGAASLAAAGKPQPELRDAIPVSVFHHRKRARSYYCYPNVYWWFYRPYTTGRDGHPRCMPYFHIPGGEGQYFKGAGTGRIK